VVERKGSGESEAIGVKLEKGAEENWSNKSDNEC
jgi:hypothetical protein